MKISIKLLVAAVSLAPLMAMGSLTADAAMHMKKKMAPKMVAYTMSAGPAIKAINKSLTGKAGDPKKGEDLMAARKKGNCFACHLISSLAVKAKQNHKKYAYMGDVAPPLDGVAGRLTEGEMRMMLVDSHKVYPDTIMPSFYRNTGFTRVKGKFKGKTVLKAQEIEDILSLMKTFK